MVPPTQRLGTTVLSAFSDHLTDSHYLSLMSSKLKCDVGLVLNLDWTGKMSVAVFKLTKRQNV